MSVRIDPLPGEGYLLLQGLPVGHGCMLHAPCIPASQLPFSVPRLNWERGLYSGPACQCCAMYQRLLVRAGKPPPVEPQASEHWRRLLTACTAQTATSNSSVGFTPDSLSLLTSSHRLPAPHSHRRRYFKAEMTPFGDQEPGAPDAYALLDFYTHSGMIHWTLNVTDVEGYSKAKLVFGNPDVTAIDGELVPAKCAVLGGRAPGGGWLGAGWRSLITSNTVSPPPNLLTAVVTYAAMDTPFNGTDNGEGECCCRCLSWISGCPAAATAARSRPLEITSAPLCLLCPLPSHAGMFGGEDIDADFPFKTVNGIAANAALGSIWAVITSDADYKNVLLAGPLEHYHPEGH